MTTDAAPFQRGISGQAPCPATRTIGVAIPIPEPWASQLTERRAAAGDPQAANVPAHLTLVGPTQITDEPLSDIEEHLCRVAADHSTFTLHLRGTGTFRPVSDVVFIAVVAGISECEVLERALRTGPLDRELRFPYHPHVTVAHDVDGAIGQERLDQVFEDMAGFEARFQVSCFTLYEHGADGCWRPRRDFPLGG